MNGRFLPALLLLTSCASSRWDAYDASSYEVVMEPSDDGYAEHIRLLEDWSADRKEPLPAGLYIELGYWLAKVGRYDEARAAFEKELARYPYVEKYLATLSALVLATTATEETEQEGADSEEVAPGSEAEAPR